LFNTREGFSRRDDSVPERFYEKREDTGWSISREEFQDMLSEYYQLRGWDRNGIPEASVLERLGIKA
jgi:aldehyde:ferredoxin oxidoreductase